GQNQYADILHLDDGSVREIVTTASSHVVWGDSDHDAFPDAIGASGGRYNFLTNIDGYAHDREVDINVSAGFGGLPTIGSPQPPATRSFEWADIDGDHFLDLVAFGNSLRVHLGGDRLDDVPIVNIDCDP